MDLIIVSRLYWRMKDSIALDKSSRLLTDEILPFAMIAKYHRCMSGKKEDKISEEHTLILLHSMSVLPDVREKMPNM